MSLETQEVHWILDSLQRRFEVRNLQELADLVSEELRIRPTM
jgi:hypothetical protein